MENILLDDDFDVKIADFGFATQEATSCERLGSRIYVSPENFRKKKYCCFANDMYAIGVMAFVMVTGYYPDNNSRMF